MGRELLDTAPVFAQSIADCEAALSPHVDWSLTDVLRETPGAPGLDRVDVVQPALFAVMVSLARLWQSHGIHPTAVIGHSQGEIAAAHIAGALTLDDAARIAALRSQALHAITGHGGMASLRLDADQTHALLEPWNNRLHIAAHNSPHTTVIAGDATALDELLEHLTTQDIRARRIDVDYASHTPTSKPSRTTSPKPSPRSPPAPATSPSTPPSPAPPPTAPNWTPTTGTPTCDSPSSSPQPSEPHSTTDTPPTSSAAPTPSSPPPSKKPSTPPPPPSPPAPSAATTTPPHNSAPPSPPPGPMAPLSPGPPTAPTPAPPTCPPTPSSAVATGSTPSRRTRPPGPAGVRSPRTRPTTRTPLCCADGWPSCRRRAASGRCSTWWRPRPPRCWGWTTARSPPTAASPSWASSP
ncbi:acyltransferase domain-containing protein [Streptacidiphilus sp. 4-A2]|nr:acyltransferase domain-containing protein [Streptacidiphilus sp. 4-A2]